MFCPKCGNQLNDGASFCPKCGGKVDGVYNRKRLQGSDDSVNKSSKNSGNTSGRKRIAIIAGSVCGVLLILLLISSMGRSKNSEEISQDIVSQDVEKEYIKPDPPVEELDVEEDIEPEQQDDTPVDIPEPMPEANEEEDEPEQSALAEEFPAQTIFEEDGVVLSFLGFAPDFSTMKLRLDNNNPDNKKAMITSLLYSLDGVCYGLNGMWVSDVLAGGSHEFEVDEEEFKRVYNRRNEVYKALGAEDLPIEMISFFIQLRIGSDSDDRTYRSYPIYSKSYKEGDLEQYYGEKIASITVLSEPGWDKYSDLYVKMDGNTATVVFANQSGVAERQRLPEHASFTVNGKRDSDFDVDIIGEGFISVHQYTVPSNYRVNNEIPNDEPLEIGVHFWTIESVNPYDYPIGTIE